ncbi:hypothetical protein Taro_025863, partial [Colocasia esculenta]|nr:hypothetical protein [Colocasia esculenta]
LLHRRDHITSWAQIAYEGKEMRAVADELKVIDLHVLKLTAHWFSREEYEKFRVDMQGKRIHIDAQFASTSKVVKRGPTMLRSVDGLQKRRVRILNFSGQVVASGILMSDDNDNVVMGKKLGGEYYE